MLALRMLQVCLMVLLPKSFAAWTAVTTFQDELAAQERGKKGEGEWCAPDTHLDVYILRLRPHQDAGVHSVLGVIEVDVGVQLACAALAYLIGTECQDHTSGAAACAFWR